MSVEYLHGSVSQVLTHSFRLTEGRKEGQPSQKKPGEGRRQNSLEHEDNVVLS